MAYERKTGDFEIRILKDGRLIMIAPDEKLVEIAESLNKQNQILNTKSQEVSNDAN
jgi:hypothetical protein